MQLTEELKQTIFNEILMDHKKRTKWKYNQVRIANRLRINQSIYSRILKGDIEKVLSESEWLRVGKKLLGDLDNPSWKPARTATLSTIYTQLEYCQANHISAIFCDEKGIGKSYSAFLFDKMNPNVALVDCSRNKTKHDMIRAIAIEFGFESQGKLKDVYGNLLDNILTLPTPTIIWDEVGDLSYAAFLEVKAIWNSLEYNCATYMMGANGLRAKMEKNIWNKKVGYEEIFDRHGDRFQNVTGVLNDSEKAIWKRRQAEAILTAQLPHLSASDTNEILNSCGLNIRRLRTEIIKYTNRKIAP